MGQVGSPVLGPLQAKAHLARAGGGGGLSCLGPEAGAPPTQPTSGAERQGRGLGLLICAPHGRGRPPRQVPHVGGAGWGWAWLCSSALLRSWG